MTDFVMGFAGGFRGSWPCGGKPQVGGNIPADSEQYPIGYHTHEPNAMQKRFAEEFMFGCNCGQTVMDLKVGDKIAIGRITVPMFAQIRSMALQFFGAPGFKVKFSWENGIDPGAPKFAKKQTFVAGAAADGSQDECKLADEAWPAEFEATDECALYIAKFDQDNPVNVAPEAGRLIMEITALPQDLTTLNNVTFAPRVDYFTLANPQNMSCCPCPCQVTTCK